MGSMEHMGGFTHGTELEIMLAAGWPFDEIEDWIEGLNEADDVKAALWLLAWAEQDRPVQRRVARDALSFVTSVG